MGPDPLDTVGSHPRGSRGRGRARGRGSRGASSSRGRSPSAWASASGSRGRGRGAAKVSRYQYYDDDDDDDEDEDDYYVVAPRGRARGRSRSQAQMRGGRTASLRGLPKQLQIIPVRGRGRGRAKMVVPPIMKGGVIDNRPIKRIEVFKTVKKTKPLCKMGNYVCPICGVRFLLNQPYGKHVKGQECRRKADYLKPTPTIEEFRMVFVVIHPGKAADSTFAYSRVPSLRLICRGILSNEPLISKDKLPALTNKEALELHFSFKQSDKSLEREQRWDFLTSRNIFNCVGSCNQFTIACRDVVNVVQSVEKKIKAAQQDNDQALVTKWNAKLTCYLTLPFHDTFNALLASKFRAFEYPSSDGSRIQSLCLRCVDSNCPGCRSAKRRQPKIIYGPERKSKAAKARQLKAKAAAAAAKLTPVKMSHYCSNCTRSFDTKTDLAAHEELCDGASDAPRTFESESAPEAPVDATVEATVEAPSASVEASSAEETEVPLPNHANGDSSAAAAQSEAHSEATDMPWMLTEQDVGEMILPD